VTTTTKRQDRQGIEVIQHLTCILNSSRHVYQTSISRRLHFMLLAEWAGKLDWGCENIKRQGGTSKDGCSDLVSSHGDRK
jgi:hypothetical protein